jgi:uncharacterized LabA/DUF88 family protein
MVMDRIAVFIDGGYVDHMVQHGFLGKLNFKTFLPYITDREEGKLVFGSYYTCMPYQKQFPSEQEKELYAKKQKLVAHISKIPGMKVKLGKLQRKSTGSYIQKRVDVLFALDLARHAWRDEIDTAVLFAGDSDFVPAIEEATSCGVKTVLYYYRPSYNRDLLHAVTESYELTPSLFQQFVRKFD